MNSVRHAAETLGQTQNCKFAFVALVKTTILSISTDSAVFFFRSKERPARRDLHGY